MKNIYIAIISIIIIITGIVYYNTSYNKKDIEAYTSFNDPTTINVNPISNTIDTFYLQQKNKVLYDLKVKLNNLKEKLYAVQIQNIIQLKGVVNEDIINTFNVSVTSKNNLEYIKYLKNITLLSNALSWTDVCNAELKYVITFVCRIFPISDNEIKKIVSCKFSSKKLKNKYLTISIYILVLYFK